MEPLIEARPNLVFGAIQRIGGFPLFVERANGPYLWDVDGNRYIDFILGYGSVVLGHADPTVCQAVIKETQTLGANPTLLNVHHITLAERVVRLCPGVERVTFMKTGSDATGAAVRLARAVTQRKYVLRWGMNGWHDWCAPVLTGVPTAARDWTLPLRYNDLNYARDLFSRHGQDIACVILMPYELDPPAPGFLLGLRELCHNAGALFILDEIRSGFRVALGGAQSLFGIEADLVTYGKAMGNGYAISALGGRAELMRHVVDVGMSVTYFRGPECMAASVATLDQLQQQNGPEQLATLGRTLMVGLDRAAHDANVPGHSCGLPWTPFLQFEYETIAQSERALRMFCNGMLARGVMMSAVHHWFLCTSMSSADIEQTIAAAAEVFAEISIQ